MTIDKAGHSCCFRHTVLYHRFAIVLILDPSLSRWLMHLSRRIDALFCLGGSFNGKTKQMPFFCSSRQDMQKITTGWRLEHSPACGCRQLGCPPRGVLGVKITGLSIRGFVSPVTVACRSLDDWPIVIWPQQTFSLDRHMP